MKKTLLLGIAAAACLAAHADSWVEKDSIVTWRFANGSLRVDAINDARNKYEGRRYVKITHGSRQLALLNGAGFDTLAASPDELYLVGLSNDGRDRSAVLVFTYDGGVLLQLAHGTANLDYCEESITVFKTWHGSEAKDIQFGENLSDVTILDCHRQRVRLFDVVSKALRVPEGVPKPE